MKHAIQRAVMRRAVVLALGGHLERELHHVEKPSSGMHAAVGAQRRSWVRRDRHDWFVGLGRARVLAHHPGPRRQVLRAVLLGQSTGTCPRTE
jgi:hypothetical protein